MNVIGFSSERKELRGLCLTEQYCFVLPRQHSMRGGGGGGGKAAGV